MLVLGWVAAGLSAALVVYLLIALLFPESLS